MSIVRAALSVLLAGLAVFVTAAPAWAHTELKSSDPADGSSLPSTPTTVTLTFEEAVTLPANPIEVTGPDGSSWTVGTATISGASVSAPVEATGPAGQYTLRYTVTADDGDAVKGTVRFTLTSAATPATTEAAAPTTAAAEAAAPVTAAPAPAARRREQWHFDVGVGRGRRHRRRRTRRRRRRARAAERGLRPPDAVTPTP